MSAGALTLSGIPASTGIGIGKAFVYSSESPVVTRRRVSRQSVDAEVARFLDAVRLVADEVHRTRHLVEVEHGADLAQIFDAQLAMLADEQVKDETVAHIRADLVVAEHAFANTMMQLKAAFEGIENEYLRARGADLRDIEQQVLRRLGGGQLHGLEAVRSNTIVVARDLLTSESLHLGRKLVKGLVLDHGGATSHASIIARSLGLPSVVGTETASRSIRSGDLIVVDGVDGVVRVRPSSDTLRYYQGELRRQHRRERDLRGRRDLPAETSDGCAITLLANVDLQQEVELALEHGAAGVGMFRTEFLFMKHEPPSEEEQLAVYRRAIEAMAPRPVVIRTFDLGGDKIAHSLPPLSEPNPFLGWRGIRLSLDNPALFKVQLRAMLRAGVAGDLRILIPMVSTIEQVRATKSLIRESAKELRREGKNCVGECKIGIMIEVPSTAVTTDLFAPEVDFFSLGTNDLVQYTLAVDRTMPRVSELYDHFHPAVLRLIQLVAASGTRHHLPTSICGEMAGDPLAAVLLLGLGIETFSLSPGLIPELKEAIRATEMSRAQEVAARCLNLESGAAVRATVEEAMGDNIPRRRKRLSQRTSA